MKIITINTHSLEEPDYERKLHEFAGVILTEQPDVFAMQEVNQSVNAEPAYEAELAGYTRCGDFSGPVRRDNHGARLAALLAREGVCYHWAWVPAKLGYGKYDEGLAIFSRRPVIQVDSFRISRSEDYKNWKTRRILGIQTADGWFYTAHMGWWDDEEEPFREQWERLGEHLEDKKNQPVWLMGDFNSIDIISGEGYDLVSGSGWKDTYCLAQEKDQGITVGKVIDGWRERLSEEKLSQCPDGMRIDYIWCSRKLPVCSSHVICNGERYPVVSDHYGVMIVV